MKQLNLSGTSSALPKLDAPPEYRGLEVVVPLPPPVTAGELLERHHRQRWAAATRRQRQPGEAVAMGDAVVMDILGYASGRMIPFSARFQHEMELWDDPILPGFAGQVAGTRIPGKATVKLTLPPDYLVAPLRGVEATFLVNVLGSAEVTLPPEDPGAMDAIAEELQRERGDRRQALTLLRRAQKLDLPIQAAEMPARA